MRLKALVLENFRAYKTAVRIPIRPGVTGIVGRNDIGKSSILEALEIFFNSETVKCDAGDLSVGATTQFITIGCIFDDLPPTVIVDETVETSFAREYLLNADGDLEILKRFKCQGKMPPPEIFIRACHPQAERIGDLLELKIADLKTLGEQIGVTVADARKSSLWRAAIWGSVTDLKLASQDIAVSKLDSKAKSIFDNVEGLLPTFALFKADRESRDGDAEAKNPMQAAVKLALDEFQNQVTAIQEQVTARVMDVANRTLGKLKEMDSSLADSLKPVFKEKPKWIFSFELEGDNGIPINKRGSGVRRLILLNFFRAEAERKAGKRNVIYAIEEPETSQHPNNQEMLIKSLIAVAARSDVQVLVTTHVPALAGLLPADGVLFVERIDGAPNISRGSDEVLDRVVRTLGVLPQREVAGAKALILVEGHSDITFLRHSADVLKANGNLSHTFCDKKIVPVPTGGCGNLNHWVTMKTADELGLPWGVLMDSDQDGTNPPKFQKKQQIISTSSALGNKLD